METKDLLQFVRFIVIKQNVPYEIYEEIMFNWLGTDNPRDVAGMYEVIVNCLPEVLIYCTTDAQLDFVARYKGELEELYRTCEFYKPKIIKRFNEWNK